MWLMTKHGFYSIVCAHDDKGQPHKNLMMIRARKKEHLERIMEYSGALGDIVETDNTDYPYRIIADRDVVVPLAGRLMDEVDYSNFKKAAAAPTGTPGDAAYQTFLHSVWASGLHMEPRGRKVNGYPISSYDEIRKAAQIYEDRDLVKRVNLFSDYKQRENHFTNGLVSVLHLGELEDLDFTATFFRELLNIELSIPILTFQVLEGYDKSSTADAILTAKNAKLFLETKIVSATLRMEQVQKHLKDIQDKAEGLQYVVLLTPDDSRSSYVRGYLDLDATRVKHLEWKRVYEYLSHYQCKTRVLRAVIMHYLSTIKDMIFEQDIVGIISKISFGEHSGVYADRYLDEMRVGEWTKWNTPKKYKNLDGTGRKLLLYDKERKAITVEVEIVRVEEANDEQGYPFTNWFAMNTLKVLRSPISAEVVESVRGFENFTHERAPYRNITHEQYRLLGIGI